MKEAGCITICMGLGCPACNSQACCLPLARPLSELPLTYIVLSFGWETSMLEGLNLYLMSEMFMQWNYALHYSTQNVMW